MSSDPFDLLGLDAKTATEADVKRAYAAKLKVTRPDDDPQGFMELCDARDAAHAQLANDNADKTPFFAPPVPQELNPVWRAFVSLGDRLQNEQSPLSIAELEAAITARDIQALEDFRNFRLLLRERVCFDTGMLERKQPMILPGLSAAGLTFLSDRLGWEDDDNDPQLREHVMWLDRLRNRYAGTLPVAVDEQEPVLNLEWTMRLVLPTLVYLIIAGFLFKWTVLS